MDGQKNCGLIPGRKKNFSSSPKHPDWLWRPCSLLFKGSQGLHPSGYSSEDIAYLPSPTSGKVMSEWCYTSISHIPSWHAQKKLHLYFSFL
jgi:hypothetical protein